LKNDAATTVLEEMINLGLALQPAPSDPIEEGVTLINSMLAHSAESPPRLVISRACPALIFALKVWTGKDEKTGACKDPIDCLRWAAVGGLADVGESLNLAEPACY
jgi:hypothetical protein